MKSQLQYYHRKHCGRSYVVNCIYKNTSQQQIHTCKTQTGKLYSVISQLDHITIKPFAAAN